MKYRVSVIIPCRNEEKTIALVLDALLHQSFPQSQMEVIIADGLSTDKTREVIQEFQASHPDMNLKIVDNPGQIIPTALNTAIRASQGEVIIRMDAHSIPQKDYVSLCLEALDKGTADNIGGVWDIRPQNDGWVARSIALAASHPIAVGDAFYRFSSKSAYVDTVPFGAYKRDLVDKIGLYDETLLSNEDYEFNTRIRQAGGRIWLDPKIRSIYFARENLSALSQQYFRYGFWKAQMLKRYPNTLRIRQALPPLFLASLVLLLLLGLLSKWFFVIFAVVAGLYLLILFFVGIQLAVKHKDFSCAGGVPMAIATMHFSWGAGFIVGLVSKRVH